MTLRSILLMFTLLPGLALAADETVSATPPATKAEDPSFGKAMNELSRFLSSTNPKTEDEWYPATEKKPGVKLIKVERKVPSKPPMHIELEKAIDMNERPKPIPILPPLATAPPETVMREPMLSPETKRLFRKTPSFIGAPKETPRGALSIEKGKFEEDYDANAVLNGGETDPAKSKFEIKVQDVKTTENEISMMDKGLKALMSGQYESAVAIYKSILTKQPNNRDVLFGLATAYHKSGQRAQARAAYGNLLQKYPDFQDGLNNFLMLAAEEAPRDALQELEQLSARNPDFAPIFAQKASIHTKLGEPDKAMANMQKALSLSPENITYKYNLAAMYDKNGEREKARGLYYELLQDSYKGKQLPVGRKDISDRLDFLSGKVTD